jgi:toxin FitB
VIVLDTDVLAALMRRRPDAALVAWLDAQPSASVWTTTMTVAEVEAGLARLEDAGRGLMLGEAFAAVLSDDLAGRILAFDRVAATAAARLAAQERRAGRPLTTRDALVAGIVLARKARLATVATQHFERLGVPVVDPWQA